MLCPTDLLPREVCASLRIGPVAPDELSESSYTRRLEESEQMGLQIVGRHSHAPEQIDVVRVEGGESARCEHYVVP